MGADNVRTPMRLQMFKPAITLLFATFCLFGQEPKQVALCDLLSKLTHWDGQMIETRGVVVASGYLYLEAKNCKLEGEIVNSSFPNWLALTAPSDHLRLHTVQYKMDQVSLRQVNLDLRRADKNTQQVSATAIGVVETNMPPKRPGGPPPHSYVGFGDQDSAPGQILIKIFKDIVIEPRDKRN